MTDSTPRRLLARLNLGFRTDSTRLNALEQHLNLTLRSARSLGLQPGVTPNWSADWNRHWDQLETALESLRAQLGKLSGYVGASATGTLEEAQESWDLLRTSEGAMFAALDEIRTTANSLEHPFQTEWRELSSRLETHLETLSALSETMQIRLQLLRHHPRSAVDQLVEAVVSTLPPLPGAQAPDAGTVERGYQRAVLELEREQHRFMDFFDALKALSMWVETPAERVEGNRMASSAPGTT
jgi:hypothetical protein